MREVWRGGTLRGLIIRSVLFGCIGGFCAEGHAQTAAAAQARPSAPTVQALFVSDIHFEPFWDPAKAERLKAAPVGDWSAILAEPETADREAKFEQLQQTCHARGVDTSYALYESSLRAMRAEAGGAKLVVLSGDLISHDFDCKFATLLPRAGPSDHREFVEKTIEFVMRNLRGALPGVPIYAALGNNDSDCGDYKLDADSPFLAAMANEFTRGFIGADRSRRRGRLPRADITVRGCRRRSTTCASLFWTTSSCRDDTRRVTARLIRRQLRRRRCGWSSN